MPDDLNQESPFVELLRENRLAAVVGIFLLLNVTGTFKYFLGLDTAILLTLVAGYKTFYNSISALLEKKISADLALCVAVIAALSVGQYVAAAEAMFIVMVGETLESYAAGRTEAAIQRFIARLPLTAKLLRDGHELEVDAATLIPGDRIIVRAGERIAADGIIEKGISSIDESSITGEPVPKDKQPGDEAYSGTLNGNAMLQIRVSRAGDETTLARVIRLVQQAKANKAPVERLADRYAKYFLPALLLAGGLTYYFTGNWLRTVAVLIVACPCALILATPTAMVAAMGGLARRGILVRGGSVLQRAAKVDTVAFDKTGTVTEGRFEIVKVIALDRAQDDLLALAAAAESASNHALARIIVEEARSRRLKIPESDNARVLPGRGVESTIGGRIVRAGNAAYLAEHGVIYSGALREEAGVLGATAVFLADGSELAGVILLRDRVRKGVREAISRLQHDGVTDLEMLTGDRRQASLVLARELGINRVQADLLPEQKHERVSQLIAQGRTVAMVGDGINDAPALAAASVGVAVAGASDITAEAADVVYLPHSLESLPRLFDVSRKAMHIAWLNIVLFAGAVNLLAVLACATGRLGPIGAAFTHQIASFCVMMNSLRLLRVEPLPGFSWQPRLLGLIQRFDLQTVFCRVLDRRQQWMKPVLTIVAGLVVMSGFYAIQPNEVGVIERFGKKVMPVRSPGLHYKLPWPMERLTRLQANRIRVVEIGFRSNKGVREVEPESYEWNVQHRSGRFQSRPDESRMLTGDQNMIELNASVHYKLEHPDSFLFRQIDGDATIQEAAESVIQGITNTTPLDSVLTTGRQDIERAALAELQRRMDRYETGIRVLRFKLEDVHPSLDVVDAFREVSGALEEKNRMVNEAEGYRNEQVALARGNAQAQLQNASAYALGRSNRSTGDANRFTQQESAYRSAPGPTTTRLYMEAVEQVLPGKKKLIVDSGKGRRHLLMLEDGVEIAPSGAGIFGSRP